MTEGRGLLELCLAAARGVESRKANRLIIDPFAENLIRCAGVCGPLAMLDTPISMDSRHPDADRMRLLVDYIAVKTHYYDNAALRAVTRGARQVVILPTTFSLRAHRLRWPRRVTIYEFGEQHLLDFADRVLAQQEAQTTVVRHLIHGWLDAAGTLALTRAGFDPDAPTAWVADDLPYLVHGSQQDATFERIVELSAPGSVIVTGEGQFVPCIEEWGDVIDALLPDAMQAANAWLTQYYDSERTSPTNWLVGHGWSVQTTTIGRQLARHGRAVPAQLKGTATYALGHQLLTAAFPHP
ncbi:SAM-dependent methyltransferase [Mycobacteroides abscessus]|nr:SAM-dependent methyltransferase [Mycobacteroides abscessus]MDM1906712.1 SAM-dependent methyltransferase [Mycobacteroides abscessus]MDM1911397.1 SAM-dependent methyltransferase [Mycobacteroides abscessus]MDM1921275.1 SAM-dependent methyltransferase [Mycobacteroides abscessus]